MFLHSLPGQGFLLKRIWMNTDLKHMCALYIHSQISFSHCDGSYFTCTCTHVAWVAVRSIHKVYIITIMLPLLLYICRVPVVRNSASHLRDTYNCNSASHLGIHHILMASFEARVHNMNNADLCSIIQKHNSNNK